MVINFIFLISSHYLLNQPGGWVGIKDPEFFKNKKAKRLRTFNKLISRIKKFNFIKLSKDNFPSNELVYMGLGIYYIFYTFTIMYSTQVALLKENDKIILTIYQIIIITGVLLAMYPILPLRIKKEIIVQVAWNIVIFYMLIFFSSFFVMISNFGQLQFAVLLLI